MLIRDNTAMRSFSSSFWTELTNTRSFFIETSPIAISCQPRDNIAPEMLDTNFRQSLDYRADLYTIGLTLYEYATGMNPFARRDEAQYTTLYRIKHDTPQPLSTLRPDLDITFCRLIDQFIKKLPALRPANLANLINRMESCR